LLALSSFPTRRSSDLAGQGVRGGRIGDENVGVVGGVDVGLARHARCLHAESELVVVRREISLGAVVGGRRIIPGTIVSAPPLVRSEEHTSELQSLTNL